MSDPTPTPPIAPTRPQTTVLHGRERVDEYAWLRNREDRDVLAYLEAENAYTETVLAHTKPLQEELYGELLARIKEDDQGAPVRDGEWLWYWRTEKGKQHRIHCRRRGSMDAPEEIVLDENALAEGEEQFSLGVFEASPDQRLLAYASDTTGAERFTLHVKDLETGELFPERIGNVGYGVAWATDNRTLYYTTLDQAMRPNKLWRHVVGTDPSQDVLVHEEPDDAFFVSVGLTRSKRFVIVHLASLVTSEAWYWPADEPDAPMRLFAARRHGIEYDVDHQEDRFLIRTNDGAVDFRVLEAPVDDPSPERWREIVPARAGVKVEAVDPFREHLVLLEREAGLRHLRILDQRTGAEERISMPEAVYALSPGDNPEYDTRTLRFSYQSLVTPPTTYDVDLDSREWTLVRRAEVLGGYDPDVYVTERLWATAPDGVQVPVSIVSRRDRPRDPSLPLWLYGYGSYGASIDATFSSLRVSLLDRGFAYAIAHIRGGGELGEPWREAGKLLRKRTTFTDFIACAEHLVKEGWTSPERLVIQGASAGGLLVGAVATMRPELFGCVVAEVPFVDVVNTVLDPTLMFSVMEHDEWGDPNDPEYYDYICSYAPYENVRAQEYPCMLVMTGMSDPRVNYWEPAKWVARLRANKTDSNRLLLRTKIVEGHGGATGRYDWLRERAFVYAFVLDTLGLA